jgi:hypothetical protein
VSASTTKQVMPLWLQRLVEVASTVKNAAWLALVIQRFWPEITYSSPWRS